MDKQALLTSRLPHDTVPIPGLGDVRVRGLSRDEALDVSQVAGTPEFEPTLLAAGMVDPELTVEEAQEWRRAAGSDEISAVCDRIAELSGLKGDSAKAAYKSNGGKRGAGRRVLSGAEAGDDGRPPASGDEQ